LFLLLLYIELTISSLIDWKHTVNFHWWHLPWPWLFWISRKLHPVTVYYWHGYYYPIYVVSFWVCALENEVPQTTTGNFCLWVTGKKSLLFSYKWKCWAPRILWLRNFGLLKILLRPQPWPCCKRMGANSTTLTQCTSYLEKIHYKNNIHVSMTAHFNLPMNIYNLLLLWNRAWKFRHVLILCYINNIWQTIRWTWEYSSAFFDLLCCQTIFYLWEA